MQNRRLENSVRNLIALYTMVIAVALSLAVKTLIDIDRGLESVGMSSALLFIAFVLTLVPFYHGALRHLDDAYIENANQHIKPGALIIDVLLLLLHAIAFVVLSLLLNKPSHFVWILLVALAIDVLWGLFAHFGSSSSNGLAAESKWTIINFIFVGGVTWYLVDRDIYLSYAGDPTKLSVLIVIACAIRTLVDYVWCRAFYFPKQEMTT